MFSYYRTIFLHETDATGVLYFSQLLKLASEAFEAYCKLKNSSVQKMIMEKIFTLPIVHVEADFKSPLFAGDDLEVSLSVKEIGISSFTLSSKILKNETLCGTVEIVHVCVDSLSKKSKPLPESMLGNLHELIQIPLKNNF